MIIYNNTVHDYLTLWIRSLIESNKKKSAVCTVTGGIDSCFNAAMILRSTSYVHVNLIFMGFKPETEKSFQKWVSNNFPQDRYSFITPKHPVIDDVSLVNIDQRLSLLSAYIDLYAKANDSITFGAITKSEYSLVKFFKTRVDEIYDYYPIIDLYRSEIIQLANFINLPQDIITEPSITINSFGFSWDMLEWLDRENDSLSIVSASDYPNLAPHWGLFDNNKKLLLLKVYQMQKDNKNKKIPDQKKCLARAALPGALS